MNHTTKTFIEAHKSKPELLGFWTELGKRNLIYLIESSYNSDIVKDLAIVDIAVREEGFLIKWKKRAIPLTDEDIKERYP